LFGVFLLPTFCNMSEEQMSDKSVEKSVVQSNFFVKELYPYQKTSIERIVSRLNQGPQNNNILFQLPTGGGKTIIFSHIAREFIKETKKRFLF
jgi:superfamily II DNA or RNA helicase